MHQKPMAKLFKGKFKDALKKTNLYGFIPPFTWRKNWVADVEPVGNGLAALKYLAPYLFRVAISNKNILPCEKHNINFRYKDRKTKKFEYTSLPATEFIRRFLQHTLPKGFQKIRYYGFLTTKNKSQLKKIISLLNLQIPNIYKTKEKPFTFYCPDCGNKMTLIYSSNRLRGPPLIILFKKAA